MGLYYGSMKSTPIIFRGNGGSGGDTIWAYYNGSDIEPGKKVLLTNIGYTIFGDETLSSDIRLTIISENGWALSDSKIRYEILDGVMDITSGVQQSGSLNVNGLPIFMLNGKFLAKPYYSNLDVATSAAYTTRVTLYPDNTPTTYQELSVIDGYFRVFLDFCHIRLSNGNIKILNDNGSWTSDYLSNYNTSITGYIYCAGTKEIFYIANRSGEIYKCVLNEGEQPYVISKIVEGLDVSFPNLGNTLAIGIKKPIETQTHTYHYVVYKNGFYYFSINNQDESQSNIYFKSYPQNILDTMGNRTVYKIQAFYDGTFSLDLSDGTTLICEFEKDDIINILEIIEPFIVEGDDTIYHISFSENKLFWCQDVPSYTSIDYKPFGFYKANESISDYLAFSPTESRFNSTILTGFMTGNLKEENGRQLIEVRTTLGI